MNLAYTSQMPGGGPLEPWLIRARQLAESFQEELGERVANALVHDSLSDAMLVHRALVATEGGDPRWARN